jgi:hypothetical protein
MYLWNTMSPKYFCLFVLLSFGGKLYSTYQYFLLALD